MPGPLEAKSSGKILDWLPIGKYNQEQVKQVISKLKSARDAYDVFWGEMTPCDHSLHIYDDDTDFLTALEAFVVGGMSSGESVVAIATESHTKVLIERLEDSGVDVKSAIDSGALIALDADETLSRFIVKGWPDDDKFRSTIDEILTLARKGNRRVRAFGEMVALLWERGDNAATIRLEHLWHELCQEKEFSLFCAYPRIGFTDTALKSLQIIREAHSRVLQPWASPA